MNLAPIILATLAISAFAAVPLKLPQDHDVDALLSSVADVCHSISSGWDDARCESACNTATELGGFGEATCEEDKCVHKCSSSCTCNGATATPDCADCSDRQRASTEGDDCQNSDGVSCAGKSFCYRRKGELASDAAACDKYWSEVVGGGDTRFECEMNEAKDGCEVVTPCCAGTATN